MTAIELQARLVEVRQRVRWMLACDGIARLAAASIALFSLASFVDWWVRVPALLRLGIVLLGVYFAARWIRRRVLAPLRREIPLGEIAQRLDARFPVTGNRLATAVDWLEGDAVGARHLWDRVLEQALDAAEKLPWKEAVHPRRAARSLAAASVLTALLAAGGGMWPPFVAVGLARYAWPWGSADWPRRVQIEPITGDVIAAAGEPITVQMKVTRGGSPRLRAWAAWREKGKPVRRELMSPDADNAYSLTLDRAPSDGTYWFEAGDDTTEDRAARVRTAARPAVVRARIRFSPPRYAASLGEAVESLESGRTEGLEGSVARAEFELSKPVSRGDKGRPAVALATLAGESIALAADDLSGRRWNGTFELKESVTLLLTATDMDGLNLRRGTAYEVGMRRDGPPSVAIVKPTHTEELSPRGELDIRVSAEDDVQVTSVRLHARVAGGTDWPAIPLGNGAVRGDEEGGASRVEVDHRWSLREHALSPGALVEYWAEAQDGYERNGERHAAARSAVMKVRIISPAELAERLREELVALARRLQKLRGEQETNREATAALSGQPGQEPEQRLALERQRAVAAAARSTAADLHAAVDRLSRNNDPDQAARDQAASAAKEVRDVAEGPMALAERRLREIGGGGGSKQAADQASASQAEAVARLDRVISGLQRWSDFDGMVQKTRDLLDRQEAAARATAAVTGELSGRDKSQLSADEKKRLEEASRRQAELSRELSELLKNYERLALALLERDRAGGDSLARAKDAAEREQVRERMNEAAEAIGENQGARADDAQQAAMRGLSAMNAALAERRERELAQLSKEAAEAAARLDRLIRAQQSLGQRTQSAAQQSSAADVLPGFAAQQRTLGGTAGGLARQIETNVRAATQAVAAVDAAAKWMASAAQHLSDAKGPASVADQASAMEALHKARAALQNVADKADEELAARTLEKVRRDLEAVRVEQAALATTADEIRQRASGDKRLSRVDGIRLNRMADEQEDLAGRVDAARKELEPSVVCDYVCQDVAGRMRDAGERLKKRDLPPAIRSQRTAAEAIAELLRTLDETAASPEKSRFAAEDETGGGAGDRGPEEASKQPLVPALAELKLLRALQSQLNDATRAFDESAPPAEARSEDELSEARRLGERQKNLHRLARKIIAEAK